jgi:hypothetical protein
MWAIFWSALLLSLTVGVSMMVAGNEQSLQAAVAADARALSALNYRKMVSDYLEANPGTPDGAIPLVSLTPFAPTGFSPNGSWQHYIQNGKLVVYSLDDKMQGTGHLLGANHDTCLIGRNRAGTFESTACGTGTNPLMLDPSIPNGAMVILGNG